MVVCAVLLFRGLRDRIVAGAAPWIAAQDALKGQPETFQRTILAERLQRIVRTGGCEAAAMWLEGGDAELVELDEHDEREDQDLPAPSLHVIETCHYPEIFSERMVRISFTSARMTSLSSTSFEL